MKLYELTYLISPDLTEEEANSFSQKIHSLIQDEGGILDQIPSPQKRGLGYQIKQKGATKKTTKQAYISLVDFRLDPEKLENLRQKLLSENQILRFAICNKKVFTAPKKIRSRSAKKIIAPAFPIPSHPTAKKTEEKVELKEIEKKLEEILNE